MGNVKKNDQRKNPYEICIYFNGCGKCTKENSYSCRSCIIANSPDPEARRAAMYSSRVIPATKIFSKN